MEPISWNFPQRTTELPGDEIFLFPTPCVPWGGQGKAAHTEEEQGKKNKKKRREKKVKYVNNLRDKAPAMEPNPFQAPAAAFGHLD